MSLRPEIVGFDYANLLTLSGSKNDRELNALYAEFDDFVKFEDDAPTQTARNCLRRAIHEGLNWDNLEVETEPHVYAAAVFALHGQKTLDTGSNDWKMPAFSLLDDAIGDKMSTASRQTFDYFLNGRPIFGQRIETEWSYYGWLSRAEVNQLLLELTGLRDRHTDLLKREEIVDFADTLRRWLRDIYSAERDLFFYCQ